MKNKTISQHLKEYFERNKLYCNSGGCVSGKTILSIFSAMNETLDNFVIFNNAGGKHFEIWTAENLQTKDTKHFLKIIKHKSIYPYVYMYKINGKETIIKNL